MRNVVRGAPALLSGPPSQVAAFCDGHLFSRLFPLLTQREKKRKLTGLFLKSSSRSLSGCGSLPCAFCYFSTRPTEIFNSPDNQTRLQRLLGHGNLLSADSGGFSSFRDLPQARFFSHRCALLLKGVLGYLLVLHSELELSRALHCVALSLR